ncbi:Aerobic respiration control sensor protein ArcB [Actinomadura rubteroloni]|uniref:histidine kinase n=1 Tax=Actinomadura rubteroloni TaxID=1926885 RepID=A0A2P4UD67_9ACTN|nr:ATP-binding protein [Actinomadura rubteroloni]POM22972.1 Aerobic respiration control sensor protein ArcB [Actinomadura rubteroloni]
MTSVVLLRFDVVDEAGVVALRQAGREVAAAAGLDASDQVRVATALSEVGRDLFQSGGGAAVTFRLGDRELVIELTRQGEAGPSGEGVRAGARLMDEVAEDDADIRLVKRLPPGARTPGPGVLGPLRARLERLVPLPALEELRNRNAELVEALEDVRRQREDLRALNAELEETNRGVLALYNEISAELEETNRGVVALYAELEEKSDLLVDAGEAKSRFWATISHELRTPVNGIIGLARLLLDPGADPLTAEQRHQLDLIAQAGGTMLSLVNELLDMAKAERGLLEPHPAPVDVRALLAMLSGLLAPMAARSGVALVVDTADAPDVLVTDETMLARVLRNILANGLTFTAAGEVRATVRAEPGRVVFVVADTGRGIPAGDRERVFEEFYQVPGAGGGGTGLGLPYARRLARVLGGDLLLDSVLGTGTTVTLVLPHAEGVAT